MTPAASKPLTRLAIATALLMVCFAVPFVQLAKFALHRDLYSHILLVPVISAYFVWLGRDQLPAAPATKVRGTTIALTLVGLSLLAVYLLASYYGARQQDRLAVAMYSFVFLESALAAAVFGPAATGALRFPLAFLFFLAPFPTGVERGLEWGLQHGSAILAEGMFRLVGTPVFRDVTLFRLPGFSMEVAPECSGIHSTLGLFLTSVVAGQLLLRSPARRAILALVVLPLALVRNGFRIVTIGELCVYVSPDMIDSWIHHHGGPFFFALSLIPFSLILWLLLRKERAPSANP